MTKSSHRARTSTVAVLAFALSLTPSVSAAQKKPKATTTPTEASFTDLSTGIAQDGQGPYFDGVDGVSSYRVSGSGTTNGWAFDLNARRTSERRTLTYDLSNPFDGPQFGAVVVNDTHGQVYDLSTMTVGEVRHVRAAFHLFIDRVEYVLRFGQTPGDGSAALKVTRLSNDAFRVTNVADDDLALFLQGNGPGAVLLGVYHVPIDLVLTNQ